MAVNILCARKGVLNAGVVGKANEFTAEGGPNEHELQADITPFTLRVTMIFRAEEGTWKVVHRHADPQLQPKQLSR